MQGLQLGTAAVITQLARELRTCLDQRFAEFGLTSQQAGILLHVSRGETSPRRLAQLLGTDTAGMTRLLDRLDAKRLVQRAPDSRDRRSIVITLTDEGAALVPKIPPVFGQTATRLSGGIDQDELQIAHRVLVRMQENLSATD